MLYQIDEAPNPNRLASFVRFLLPLSSMASDSPAALVSPPMDVDQPPPDPPPQRPPDPPHHPPDPAHSPPLMTIQVDPLPTRLRHEIEGNQSGGEERGEVPRPLPRYASAGVSGGAPEVGAPHRHGGVGILGRPQML
ncbi:hypothetical protein BDA96_04G148800 [Sorghum bicolor]|uniref:Uncharacterized protein n=1 Tax=Sorghum bicolor TaxID=4558 RepID=A0A921R538_SORBI|nr:hypothetical protein BDA96_04G148800 [Sorghum bicolor]